MTRSKIKIDDVVRFGPTIPCASRYVWPYEDGVLHTGVSPTHANGLWRFQVARIQDYSGERRALIVSGRFAGWFDLDGLDRVEASAT